MFGGGFDCLEKEEKQKKRRRYRNHTHISFDNSFVQPDLASKAQQLRRVSTSGTQRQQQCGGIHASEASSVTEFLDYQERNSDDGAHLD